MAWLPVTRKTPRAVLATMLLCAASLAACEKSPTPIVYRPNGAFSVTERRAIESIAKTTVRDIRRVLPGIPPTFGLFVNTGDQVIPETGETGSVSMPSGVYWTVDPDHAGGVLSVVKTQLRPTLFHELFHMVRGMAIPSRSLRDRAIGEGLATVFERDFGPGVTPWGDYPPEIRQWTAEFLALPDDAEREHWMVKHPDGRRWVGFKVGTYLVDQALHVSGKSVTQLATIPTEQIIAWALQS